MPMSKMGFEIELDNKIRGGVGVSVQITMTDMLLLEKCSKNGG